MAVDKELWEAIETEILELGKAHPEEPSTYRGTAMVDSSGSVHVMHKRQRADGTNSVYFIKAYRTFRKQIEVVTDHYIDSNERYWNSQLSDRSNAVVIDGTHYRIGTSKGGVHSGYGGREFKIEFLDGREVVTRDLWYQGKIPPMFRDRMPDNARFVS